MQVSDLGCRRPLWSCWGSMGSIHPFRKAQFWSGLKLFSCIVFGGLRFPRHFCKSEKVLDFPPFSHQFTSLFETKGKTLALRRHPSETYLDKVFDFSATVGALPDSRQSPRHSGKKVFDAVFLRAACQFPALHRMETECQRGAFPNALALSAKTPSGTPSNGRIPVLFSPSAVISPVP
jgi:hypothetical protein